MKRLLANATILLREDGVWKTIPRGYVGIEDALIRYVGEAPPKEEYDEIKECADRLIMPGLYNLHTHSPMTLLRGVGSGLPLDRWLNEAIFPLEAKMTPRDISAGTRIALAEMLASGVVSFTDMYDMPGITCDEVVSAGMKANLCRPILAFDPDEPYESNFRVRESIDFHEEYHGTGSGRVKVDFAIHAEYTNLPHVVQRYSEECFVRGARMHLHLSETEKEHENCKAKYGKTPARWFADLGVFESPTTAAHCVFAEPEDMAIMAEKGVTAVHNPTSNMKLGSGFMPIEDFMKAGVRIGLGTDGAASNNNLNLFEEMHLASILHKGYHRDPTLIRPEDILTWATENGALAQGRTDCGMLRAGCCADLIALDLTKPHLCPANDLPSLVVYAAQAGDVCMTMVNGRILYENGEFPTIDMERARHDLKAAVKRLAG